MKLTGKALEDFTQWNSNKQFDMMLPFEYPTYLNALIIEWFDSVGIYIHIQPTELGDSLEFKAKVNEEDVCFGYGFLFFETRQQATEQAIIKANDIYNER